MALFHSQTGRHRYTSVFNVLLCCKLHNLARKQSEEQLHLPLQNGSVRVVESLTVRPMINTQSLTTLHHRVQGGSAVTQW